MYKIENFLTSLNCKILTWWLEDWLEDGKDATEPPMDEQEPVHDPSGVQAPVHDALHVHDELHVHEGVLGCPDSLPDSNSFENPESKLSDSEAEKLEIY